MNQSFYAAAVAASQQQQRLNVTANNLANVNTVGFKGEQAQFADLLYRNLVGPENAQLPRGSGSRMIQTTTDFAPGAMMTRTDGQNYAIQGDGFFCRTRPADQSGQLYPRRCFPLGQRDAGRSDDLLSVRSARQLCAQSEPAAHPHDR